MKNFLTYILILALMGCSDSEYYKVRFDDVDYLKEGDAVILKGLEVGQVKGLKLESDYTILATIWVGRNIKLTKGSTFTIQSDIYGRRHVEIKPADTHDLMDTEEIQIGYLQPPDTTRMRTLTAAERDSLVKYDPMFKLADTVMTILRKSKLSKKVE
jgi:ABC-type transporter Mla subunit MlaD